MRLALARYNGVDLKWVNTDNPSQFLEWAGAHTEVSFSPDGKYILTGSNNGHARIWTAAGELVNTYDKELLPTLTNLLMVVIPFYFGSAAAVEIAQIQKKSREEKNGDKGE